MTLRNVSEGYDMKILTKEEIDKILSNHCAENYGERDTDEWFESSAVNVRVFKRDGKYISLKAHILTGVVEEYIE